eukprot:m.35414 g.35414  ORF g.35414 m.35414 type:complete len:186 (-) comp7448_c0_seq1:2004-2561(-)
MAAARPSVKVVAVLPPSPEELFKGFTDPDKFQQWFMLDWGQECTTDPVVGGRYELKGETPTGAKVSCDGSYEVVDSPHHLRFTFLWHGDAAIQTSTVPETWPQPMDVTFSPVDGGTEVTFVHEQVAHAASGEAHREAWELGLQMLAEVVGGEAASDRLAEEFGMLAALMGGGGAADLLEEAGADK